MVFTRDTLTGVITVDAWARGPEWAQQLLEMADQEHLWVEDDVIHVRVANGWADYRIVERWAEPPTVLSVLLECGGEAPIEGG